MRVSLLSLSLSLSLAMLGLAAPEAEAQPCGTTIGSSELAIENVLDEDGAVFITIYDRTGTPAAPTTIYGAPNTASQTTVQLPTVDAAGCDVFVGFPEGSRLDPPSQYILFEYTPIFPVTVEFSYLETPGGASSPTVIGRFVYGGGLPSTNNSFFNPQGGDGDVYFEVTSGGVRVSPDDFWTANGGHVRFMEDLIPDGGWVFPYHSEAFCAVLSCTSTNVLNPQQTGSPFLMPVDAVFVYGQPLLKHLTPVLSMAFTGDNINWTEDWLTLAFAPGTGFSVDGTGNRIAGLTLTSSDAHDGWRGVSIPGGAMVFDGTRVTDVSYDDGNYYKRANSAVTVTGGATFTLRGGGEVSGARMAQGIEAVGATVIIEGPLTTVSDNDYAGVVAMPGASVTVRDQAQVIRNAGGVVASGTGAVVSLDLGRVQTNEGVGAMASGGGLVRTVSSATTQQRTSVSENHSGLDAMGAGSIRMGSYNSKTGVCLNCGHLIATNTPTLADFDAHAFGQSAVRAQGNDWNVGDVNCLRLANDGSSTLLVTPFIVTNPTVCTVIGGRAAGSDAVRMDWSESTDVAARGGTSNALDAVVEAEDALADGDAAEATSLLVVALSEAATDDERAGVYGGLVRILAVVQPAALVAEIESHANGPDRPWALRALAIAADATGNAAAATDYASALASEFAGTEHAAAGLGWLARLATDETSAMAHLVALWDAAPTSQTFAESAAVVAATFPDADFGWVPAGRAVVPGVTVAGKAETELAAEAVLTIWPNPTHGTARLTVPTATGETLDVDVYDGLGRRVAVVAEGAVASGASFEASLPTADLPPGVYLVRVMRHSTDGRDAVSVVRLTVTR